MYKNDILFSIIITTYNNEKYIDKCLKEVLRQYNNSMEIIVIDDGSHDNTIKICEKHLRQKRNTKIVANNHNGLSYSRNLGIKHARGNYIVFIDGDDWIDKDYLKNAANIISKNQYDVILIDTIKFYEKDNSFCIEKFDFDTLDLFPSHLTMEKLINNNICGRAWRLIVKRRFILNHRFMFTPNILHEDEEWITLIFNTYNTIYYANNIKYYYRQHDNSIMANKTIQNYLDLLTVAKKLFEYNNKNNLQYTKYLQYVVFRCIRNSFGNYEKFNKTEKSLLKTWYINNKKVYRFGARYRILSFLLYSLLGYHKGMEIYKTLVTNKNNRKDIIKKNS